MSSYTNWQGYLKTRYGAFSDPLPSPNTIADFVPFMTAEKIGDLFQFPVRLGLEHGVTRDDTRSAFSLSGALDSVVLPAQISGSSINMEGTIPRPMQAAMAAGNMASYDQSMDAKILGLAGGGELNREIDLHYGVGPGATVSDNIGVISTVVSGTNLGSSGPIVCDLTSASWSAGLWNLMVGAEVDIYDPDLSTPVETHVTVTAVSVANNRLTLSKTGSTALPATSDIIVPRDGLGNSCYGLNAILSNSGSLFNISAATYPQWKALSYAVSGAMTRAHVLAFAARLQQNGLKEGGKLFLNANAVADLIEEASDYQRYNNNTDSVKVQGAENVTYKTPAGLIEVATDMIMKQSLGMFLANENGKRVGTTDLTFRLPGSDDWFYQELESSAGSKLQMYSEQGIILTKPYHNALLTGISSTGDTDPSA